jgi:hypothetical protein
MNGAVAGALGAALAALPPALAAAHGPGTVLHFHGTAEVEPAATFLGRLMARLFGMPTQGGRFPITLAKHRLAGDRERWERRIGPACFHSTLLAAGPMRVAERLGPLEAELALRVEDGALVLEMVAARLLGLPLPRWLRPVCVARETAVASSALAFRFDVPITLPLLGRLVRYSGELAPSA